MENSTPSESLKQAVAEFGSLVRFAAALGVPYQRVQAWYRNRVPAQYCPVIERLLDGRVCCEALRPDIDWGYLRRNKRRASS